MSDFGTWTEAMQSGLTMDAIIALPSVTMPIAGKSACNLDHWLLIVLLFRLLGGTTSGVLPVSVEEVSVSALQVLQHCSMARIFQQKAVTLQRTADRGGHWLADCRLCPNTGVWAHWASDGGRGDVWRTEAAGTQPRAGHWHQWLPGTSTGTTAADPDSRNPAWALLLLLQVQSHFTAAAARQAASSQAVWWRVSDCRGAVSSVHSCVITHHNSPPPARAWPGSSYTASCLTSTSPGGPCTTVVTTLTGMGVKYCVETESFYIDIQVWVQLWNLTLRKFQH